MRCLTLGSAATGAISLRNGKPGMQHWSRHSLTALCCQARSGDGWMPVPSTSHLARGARHWDGAGERMAG